MSDSEQQQESESFAPTTHCQGDRESGSEAEDDGEMEECTLLQEMGEEDEDIDLYNEETFGLDLEVRPDEGDPSDILVFCGDESPGPPSPPPCTPNTLAPLIQVQPALNGRPREKRTLRRGDVFEDPAIMRTVKSRPSLKVSEEKGKEHALIMCCRTHHMTNHLRDENLSAAMWRVIPQHHTSPNGPSLDSAIVDSGIGSPCDSLDLDTWMLSPFGPSQKSVGPMLQDQAIVTVIGSQDLARTPPTPLDFLSPLRRPFPVTGGGKRGGQRGHQPLMRPLGQRYLSQMPMSPLLTGSPVCLRPPFGSPQHYMQRGGFMSPSRPSMTVPQPFTPKMMQLRFGARSPSPSPVYSPSANPMQRFRFPGHVTQLHPQHRRLLSHRHQRSHRGENLDPNGQLMSMKEKEWIIKLQMIQLQSENPHLDDYYYQEYYRRLEAKMAEEEMLGERGKREPPKLTTPYVTKTESYTPVVHIEGSLGQVAVSTCFSPRRAIDAVHAHLPEESHFSEQEQKDARQQRLTVLHNIEKLFMILLEVEEGEKMKRSTFSEEERVRLDEKISRRVKQIYGQLQRPPNLEDSEEFLPCLLVSKGKRLMARLLPFLSESDAQHVLKVVTVHLPALMSRDTDEALPVIYPSLCTVIGELSFNQLIGVLKGFTSTLPDSKEMCLTIACQNKFGISLLYALLSQGERLLSSNTPMEAGIGDYETWTETVFLVARRLSRASLVEPLLLPSNLLSLFCRYLDKHTVHQLEDSMERSTASCPAVPS